MLPQILFEVPMLPALDRSKLVFSNI